MARAVQRASRIMADDPEEKPLQATSFTIHATRGVIRDTNMRRKAMFYLLIVALVMIFAGCTFLSGVLNPREHLVRALIYWFGCVWLTLTAMLLAVFDVAKVRSDARKEERLLRQQYSSTAPSERASNETNNARNAS